jgi:soluble lytic murein transglycosylase
LKRAGGTAGPAFTETEAAAVAGRLLVAQAAFVEALEQFRPVLGTEPALFLQYPELFTGLGRSFQFGGRDNAGTELFLKWEEELRKPDAVPGASMVSPPEPAAVRYRLLYFAGRIERQRGRHGEAAALFSRAVELAPDGLQADACIWYILSMAFQDNPGEMTELLKVWIPRWRRAAYFDDILDRLARYHASRQQWQTILELYRLLKPGSARAQYAYIVGRAAELGYLTGVKAEEFYREALNEKDASFYYKALSSFRLGPVQTLSPLPSPAKPHDFPHPAQMEFLLGFFEHGAAQFAVPYITKYRQELSADELRALAEALQRAGFWDESFRLIQVYLEQDDYEINRSDLELYYPRPFREMVETYAGELEIPPYLLFGLIRTESAFVTGITSRAGAVGLTQLMPETAAEMAGRLKRRGGPDYGREEGIDLTDPGANVHLGAFYLRYLLDRLENPMLSLLAYNGGIGRVRRWRAEAPKLTADLLTETVEFTETRSYGRRVAAAAAVYGFLYYDLTMEAVIADMIE